MLSLCFTLFQTTTGGPIKKPQRKNSKQSKKLQKKNPPSSLSSSSPPVALSLQICRNNLTPKSHQCFIYKAIRRKIVEFLSLFKKRCGGDALTRVMFENDTGNTSFLDMFSCAIQRTTQLVLFQHLCKFFPLIRRCRKGRKRLLFLHTRHRLPESKLFHCATIVQRNHKKKKFVRYNS